MWLILRIRRNLEDQSESIAKMWGKAYLKDSFITWLQNQEEWMNAFEKELRITPLELFFEDVIKYPVECMEKICSFCDITMPKKSYVEEWIYE